MYNTLQISYSISSNADTVVSAGITFLLKHWGHTNVLHPSNMKTFGLPVAHKTAELFEPSVCLSAHTFLTSFSVTFSLICSFLSGSSFLLLCSKYKGNKWWD